MLDMSPRNKLDAKLPSRWPRRAAQVLRVNAPWNLHLRIGLACGRRRQMLQAQQALRLELKQRLVGWEADVVASLGSRAT